MLRAKDEISLMVNEMAICIYTHCTLLYTICYCIWLIMWCELLYAHYMSNVELISHSYPLQPKSRNIFSSPAAHYSLDEQFAWRIVVDNFDFSRMFLKMSVLFLMQTWLVPWKFLTIPNAVLCWLSLATRNINFFIVKSRSQFTLSMHCVF